jgi:DNA-binding HxlR family transcriptional regulator
VDVDHRPDLLAGCRTFGELLEGPSGISRALLAQHLVLLEQHEVIVREVARGRVRHALTGRGQELRAVVQVLGEWGARWLELEPHHSDPAYVLFATSRLVDVERAPAHGLVVLRAGRPALLAAGPPSAGRSVRVLPRQARGPVRARTRSEVLARCHLRHTTFAQVERVGQLEIDGPRPTARAFLACIRPSPFAVTTYVGPHHRAAAQRTGVASVSEEAT